jgi:predicted helicase
MLPRIPLVEDPWPFVEAGRWLAEIHLGYEWEDPFRLTASAPSQQATRTSSSQSKR